MAPERAIATQLLQAFGRGYLATDIGTARLSKQLPADAPRALLDLCNIDDDFLQRRFDLIVHSHVLEHIYGNWAIALLQLHAMLQPGGVQVFSIPMFGEYTAENLDPELPASVRLKEYYQTEHTRRFGARTFAQDMRNVVQLTKSRRFVEAKALFTADELNHMRANGHVFILEAPVG